MTDSLHFLIDGEWRQPKGSGRIPVLNPTTEETLAEIAIASEADVHDAVAAARAAFPKWSMRPLSDRLDLMRVIASELRTRGQEIADLITAEMGMPCYTAFYDQVDHPIDFIDDWIRIAKTYAFVDEPSKGLIIQKEPMGVVAAITPWNFPMLQIIGKVIPAMITGSTVVIKPSEIAPLGAMLFADICNAAGLPPGVLNLINGDGPKTGNALASHPDVDMISFTGSSRTGALISRAAADGIKKVTLELGGKSPNILLDDADFETAIPKGLDMAFLNTGQICIAPSRMLVPESRKQEAEDIAKRITEEMRIGDPTDKDTYLGPLVSAAQYDRVQKYIQIGIEEGARLVTGGTGAPDGLNRGYFVKPTVFADVANDMTIAREEIFGPVLCMIAYQDEEDAIRIANDTEYGLSSCVWSKDVERANRVAARIQAGNVVVNGGNYEVLPPMGGYKKSGIGCEYGVWGLEDYLQIKAIIGPIDGAPIYPV